MPIVSKLFKKNDNDDKSNTDMHVPEQSSEDIQINDFSDNIDLGGLGDLLGGGLPSSDSLSSGGGLESNTDLYGQTEQEPPKPEKVKKSLNIGKSIAGLFGAIADKFKNKKKNGDIPELTAQNGQTDPNYVSDTVSIVDYNSGMQADSVEPPSDDFSQNLPQVERQVGEDNFDVQVSPPEEIPQSSNNMYAPPYYGDMPNTAASVPFNYNVYEPSAPEGLPDSLPNNQSDMPQNEVQKFQGTEIGADIHIDFDDSAAETIIDSANESDLREKSSQQESENEFYSEPRRHDIMGAFRARIEQFRKRLPSFKPKEYRIPEPTYQPQEDSIKSPSLAADIESIIAKRNDLGEVSREYDEMRRYIQSVDENVRLSRDEIAVPENIDEVYAAQNELLHMIDQISLENEQQRSRIGVYEKQSEDDPYNYRGINDERQNYTDIETSSFSMTSGINFESEKNVSPNRFFMEQQYNEQMYGTQFDDDFDDSDSDFGLNSVYDYGSDTQFDDNWSDDLDLDDDFDSEPRQRPYSR